MSHRIEVGFRSELIDPREDATVAGIRDLGITSIDYVHVADVYYLDASLPDEQLDLICSRLLSDSVAQAWTHDGSHVREHEGALGAFEVAYNRGVSDPLADTVMKGIRDLGIEGVEKARTGIRYVLYGNATPGELELIINQLLLNPIVQHVVEESEEPFYHEPRYELDVLTVPLGSMSDDEAASLASRFGFNAVELAAIRQHFERVGRDPTDVEIETIAQSWSEHCVHKTFKARIDVDGEIIDNLLRNTIVKATNTLNKEWCLSVFEDNAGVIDFDGENAICFKVETHNHPSAVEPYGGAATGLGGVVRDVLGTGLGARPVLNTDVFCFGPPDLPYNRLPAGVLHPRRVLKGVRAGVADYGNRLGIPTLNGTLRFDDRYLANPLVFCGTAGVMPVSGAKLGKQQTGDHVMLIGGRTGRDGIHGVTFASEKLDEQSVSSSRSAVQIGNPIVEKRAIDALMQARDKGLYRRITDCGGGGLSSAVGEMGADTGVRVHLDRVPLKYAGLSYDEIWISESQERMILAVPPEHIVELCAICESEGVEATDIGEFTDTHRLELLYDGTRVGDLEMEFLHDGRPQLDLKAHKPSVAFEGEDPVHASAPGEALLGILSSLNVCSKEWVIRQYDHEVQGGSVLKPLVGVEADGPGDAAVLRPILDSGRGLIVSNGINTRYGDLDPYWMAASAIDEALRQIIAVGGDLERVALLDNFCWGDVSDPAQLWALVQACRACHDMSLAFGVPFISGKDSLNNYAEIAGETISIPHTLLISAIGVMPDTGRAVSMDLKKPGNLLYVVGATYPELGGSEYAALSGATGAAVPQVRTEDSRDVMEALSFAVREDLVAACHDLSEGGLGVAAAEMAFAGRLGASIDLRTVPLGEETTRDDVVLFSESNSRFLVEISPEDRDEFEKRLRGLPCAHIGYVESTDRLIVLGLAGTTIVDSPLVEIGRAWQGPMDW